MEWCKLGGRKKIKCLGEQDAIKELQFKEVRDSKGEIRSIVLVLKRKQIIELSKIYPHRKVIAFMFCKEKNGNLKVRI